MTVTMAPSFARAVRYNERVAKAPDFKLALAHLIKPTGGPGVELTTLEDAARFIAALRPWRQTRPFLGLRGRAIVEGGADREEG